MNENPTRLPSPANLDVQPGAIVCDESSGMVREVRPIQAGATPANADRGNVTQAEISKLIIEYFATLLVEPWVKADSDAAWAKIRAALTAAGVPQ